MALKWFSISLLIYKSNKYFWVPTEYIFIEENSRNKKEKNEEVPKLQEFLLWTLYWYQIDN